MTLILVSALLAVLCVHSATAKCPEGSIKGLDRWTCYKVYSAALSWNKAESRCAAEGGHLATIPSASNNSYLREVAGTVALSSYWVGGARDQRDDAWYWSDGSAWNFTNWATDQPVNGSVCISFNAISGKWFAEGCGAAESFLCQVPPVTAVVPPPPNLPRAPAPLRCPYDWKYLGDTNLCYMILSHTAFSWDLAKTMCLDAGGGLVSIPSKEVGDAISNYVLEAFLNVDSASGNMVIGAFYNNSNDQWEWADGAEMRHTNWAVGEPHNVGSLDRCGYMGLRAPEIGTWRNNVCAPETSTNVDVICERAPFEFSNGGAPPPPNLPAAPPPVQCPEGWRYLQASNLCYAVMEPREDQFTWNEARSVCAEAGGDLASIPNRNVQDALILLAADAEFVRGPEPNKNWVLLAIGASYNDTIDQWEWSDGAEMRYTNWHNADEYGPVDGCAYMRLAPIGVGTWQKMDCLHGGGDWARLCERSAFDI